MSAIKYVIYYRVSTKQQGESGLGLEAQMRDVNIYLEQYSERPYEIIDTVTDVKSGKGNINDRPELKRAVELAAKHEAVLLVAKLDRLGRDVELIAHLIKRTDLKVACMPQADKFQLHLYAALAEQEREFISKRTKAALESAKERGVKLGGLRKGTAERNAGAKKAADERAEKYRSELELLLTHSEGFSLRKIAESLNEREVTTPNGGKWQATQVKRMIERLGLKANTPAQTN
ncbi:recombinase family protein [Vibrio furnissii]|uniref:recombinase family protein n=1 Tax=Vibrio furnissii TaxID=29494 RepID=UPI003D7DE18E